MKLFIKSFFVELFSRVHYKKNGLFPVTKCNYNDFNVGSNACRDSCEYFVSKNSFKKYVCCKMKLLDMSRT